MNSYNLQMDILRLDFKSGLEALLKANPIRAIFLGVRIGDPTAVMKYDLKLFQLLGHFFRIFVDVICG